jgi:tRNA (cytidine/uridine-2'-O-)-methyltransferase
MFHLDIILYQPEIPQNTGNIARTCAALGAGLHLIKPLGFSLDDRYLKRAGLDYWPLVKVETYSELDDFFTRQKAGRPVFFSKKAGRRYDQMDYSGHIQLIFGSETRGIPESLLLKNHDRCCRIPTRDQARSLNLANAVAVAGYEAFRQNQFPGLRLQGNGI